MRAKARFSPVL
jgi:DNA-binding NarL/FixJ family response regulator